VRLWQKIKFLVPVDGLKQTTGRFPVSSLCALAFAVLVILNIHDVVGDGDWFGRALICLALVFFGAGVLTLMGEAYQWHRARVHGATAAFFAVSAGMVVMSGATDELALFTVLWLSGLFLMIGVSPYLKGGDSLSLWFFNETINIGVLTSLFAGVVWGAGLSGALGAVDLLFGVDIDGDFYATIWVLIGFLFIPLYALSWVPQRFSFTDADCHAPPQVAFIINWILAPLVVLYLVILYAYFIKLVVTRTLPIEMASWLIAGFGGAGVLTYLCGWPLRDTGGPMLRFVCRYFFWAMIIPAILQLWAIGLRIHDFGVTEQRYMIAACGLWLLGVSAVYAGRPNMPIKYIILSLVAVLFVVSLEGVGARALGVQSQMSRLTALVAAHDLRADKQTALLFKDQSNLSSIIDYLVYRGGRDDLAKRFPVLAGLKEGQMSAADVMKALGVQYIDPYQRQTFCCQGKEGRFDLSLKAGQSESFMNISGYDVISEEWYANLRHERQESFSGVVMDKRGLIDFQTTITVRGLDVQVGDYSPLAFDVLTPVQELIQKRRIAAEDSALAPIEVVQEQGGLKGKLIVTYISGQYREGKETELEHFSYRLLIRFP
jgi:hypothetical protein